jgi:protein-disulfide isomerase
MILMSFTPTLDRRGLLAGAATLAAGAFAGSFAGRAFAQGAEMPSIESYVHGDPDAPVKLIEYASLTCPHCANFHVTTYQDLKRDYIDTGKANLEFREVFFDKEGLWAAMLARCGGEAKYFGFVDILLRKQKEWARAENVPVELMKIGRLGGLTKEEMDACLQNNDFARAMVEKYQGYRDDPLLQGTPTLILDGEALNHSSAEEIAAAIDAKL